ncbi:MAG TPA: SET domain-containing protein-lysine N-methyltransferase [Terracidiphilus sp.]|jgi:hypothetical protein|nr:SET domain-containing protein-lysine N-methyltransferase [Terracidiphilus sp.]
MHKVLKSFKEFIRFRMGLIIRSSAIHAAGCYTTTSIRKGSRVAEYTGPRLNKTEADTRYDETPVTYLFGLGDGTVVIDGHCMAMFINHSCDPNCETHEEKGRVWIKAIRTIVAGEEITYDYCLYDGDDDEARCNCGTRKCRGTMYSREEARKRRGSVTKRSEPRSHSDQAKRKRKK